MNLFRSAMNFAYPIAAPSLPGGMNPGVSLNYSSVGGQHLAKGDTWLGYGWSMYVPPIERGVGCKQRVLFLDPPALSAIARYCGERHDT